MTMLTVDVWAITASSIVTVVGACVAWLRVVRPKWDKAKTKTIAAVDSIVGREEVRDSITGALVQPALPGIGVRMARTEENVALLADAVTALTQTHRRLDDHDRMFIEHAKEHQVLRGDIADLKAQRMERVASHIESAAAFDTISKLADQATGGDDSTPVADK